VPGPRYTSYPTVPYWNETEFTYDGSLPLQNLLLKAIVKKHAYTFTCHFGKYVHFCGCNKRITKNHEVHPYIEAIIKNGFIL
jgi:oxygen-independent coproporphyrinogen-3 oxidase